MKEKLISRAYAKSVVQLGKENGIDIARELTELSLLINENNDLETVLFLEVFTLEEKTQVLNDVLKKMNLSSLTQNFMNFLLSEKRISLFPMVFKEVVVLDDEEKGFLRGTIEGAGPSVGPEFQEKMTQYLSQKIGKKTILEYKQSDRVTAGYRVTLEDLQLDATLDNQLNKFKQSVLNS
jgi:F-type H+-transporting ATPase subunit delta